MINLYNPSTQEEVCAATSAVFGEVEALAKYPGFIVTVTHEPGQVWEEGVWVDPPTPAATPEEEQEWVRNTLLNIVDPQINCHIDGDTKRMTYTLERWKKYRVALRDYVTVEEGVLTVNGDRPAV